MPNRFAVMGNPVAHSLSPYIHHRFAEQTGKKLDYEKICVDEASFETKVTDFFAEGGKGLNITLPFKQRAFAMATVNTARCLEAKAANTLWMQGGQLHADNTDGIGLLRDLAHYLDLNNKHVLLLGAGGAARGVIGPLLKAGIADLTLANRTLAKAQALQQDFEGIQCCSFTDLTQRFDLVINATSASLGEEKLALPAAILKPATYCYDLAYRSHGSTSFVRWAKEHGCNATDGLGMLVEQAAEAFFIWHGVKPETNIVLAELQQRGL
ncbi:shikimate 5-dehydrogenase [Legionella lansingensis]|uniref:Shikimate dehydrogenase (NADP(+)) n=1 Tax=Legionella lansingensis TaxID=45067 RepID=A0A0W0VRC0_9GAMM|nr:shikimate dehydrogenase [Legionella lansingensis]KTD22654.1 shikimate 5-dehydrogenase [Legionella lansingensis]SNV55872.1 shikimate 5-dehydrogenase [Legionella lansingensis]